MSRWTPEAREIPPIELISWLDSRSEVGKPWTDGTDFDDSFEEEYSVCYSTGFVVGENEDQVVLAHSYDHDSDSWGCYIQIPKCCIKERTPLTTKSVEYVKEMVKNSDPVGPSDLGDAIDEFAHSAGV